MGCLSQETCLFFVEGSCGRQEIFILQGILICMSNHSKEREFSVYKKIFGPDAVHWVFFAAL
jgi:hypothetical protein